MRAVYEPTDLAAFTADLASNFRSACEKAGLRLVVDCPPLAEPVYVDREMWEKIVLNLLSNAFKFTFEGEIAVSLRQAGRCCRTAGAGHRHRHPGRGDAPAVRAVPPGRERTGPDARGQRHRPGPGAGTGQAARRLHHRRERRRAGHDLHLSVPLGSAHLPPDQIGEGRTLRLDGNGGRPLRRGGAALASRRRGWRGRRPLGTADSTTNRYPRLYRRGEAEGDDRPRVLVADDNADMRQYVVRLLAEHVPRRGRAGRRGGAGGGAAAAPGPDPDRRDDAPAGRLRAACGNCGPTPAPAACRSSCCRPVPGEESRVEGMEAGADDYLVKPFSARELLARVSAHLQMARMRREASESLRQSEERLRMALTAARMVAWQLDPTTGNVVVSDNAADVFGLPPGTPLEHSEQGFALVHPDDVERHRAEVTKAVEECGSYLTQFRMIRPENGAVIWVEERGQAVSEGQPPAVRLVGVLMDITERKQAEEALREADQRKDEFLAMLAHELRNPLAPVRNSLHILRVRGLDEATVDRARQMMERQVEHLVRLVDDLLDVSRIMRGKIVLRKEPVKVAAVVARALETAQPVIDAQGHEVNVSLPPEPLIVEGDLIRLSQVVGNLLTNAAKYTEKAGRIWLTAERDRQELLIRVQDNGLGIPPEMLPKVFDLFMQAERSLDRSQGGLGIGLTLVKRLVEMHNGSVTAFSEGPGKGSTFTIRLPLMQPSDIATPKWMQKDGNVGQQVAAMPRRRVLVVDDNVDAAESLAMMLRMWHHDVLTVHDGPQALGAAPSYRPEIVILDIGLPGISGYEVARRIRERPEFADVLLVAMTGYGQDEDRRRSQEAGFDYHLTKPASPEELQKLIATVAARSNGKR